MADTIKYVKLTEVEAADEVKEAASVVITQAETADGEEVESVRRAPLEELMAAMAATEDDIAEILSTIKGENDGEEEES